MYYPGQYTVAQSALDRISRSHTSLSSFLADHSIPSCYVSAILNCFQLPVQIVFFTYVPPLLLPLYYQRILYLINSYQVLCCLAAKSYMTFRHPLDCSTPDFLVLHYLSEFAQFMFIESVMLCSHLILCHFLLFLPSIFPSIIVFSKVSSFASGGQSTGVSASVLPMNIQD